jgi:cytochrome P450
MFVKGRGNQRARLLLGNGLLTSEGEFHHQQRRIAHPPFHRQRIGVAADAIVQCTIAACARWHSGEPVDIYREMSRLTLSIAGRALFGTDFTEEADDLHAALTDVLQYFDFAIVPGSELLDRMPFLPPVRRFRRGRDRLDATIHRVIAGARRYGEGREDLAAHLVRAHDDLGRAGAHDEQLRDELMTLLIAGYETVSDSLTWTLLLLARHADVETRLRAELTTVLGGRAATAADLDRLVYTKMVVSESLRLYPTAYIGGYEPLDDYELGDGWIPRGSLVLMCQYIVHRDERWFPEPERFDPERWSPERQVERPRYAYFPFGGGPRQCIGEHFAWMEATLVLATIAQHWTLRALSPELPGIYATLTLRPRGDTRLQVENAGA